MANPPGIEIEKDETASDGRHRDLQDNIEKKRFRCIMEDFRISLQRRTEEEINLNET